MTQLDFILEKFSMNMEVKTEMKTLNERQLRK